MSRLKRDIYRRKLGRLLSRADDEGFFQLVWAIDAIQSGREGVAKPYLQFPKEAVTSDISSSYIVPKWDLETLLGELLITPKYQLHTGLNQVTDCTRFETVAGAINCLRTLEEAEADIYLKHFSIFGEMHRIGQRQFPWQRGYVNLSQYYRNLYIYGQGVCANYFREKYGLTINEFSYFGFLLHTMFMHQPSGPLVLHLETAPSEVSQRAAVKLLSLPISELRREAQSLVLAANKHHGAPLPTIYRPSILRRFPVVAFGSHSVRIRAPLPSLIVLRTTAGLYYDMIGGGQHLLNEANDRFEMYAARYISVTMPRFLVTRSSKYIFNGNQLESV